MTVKDKDVTVDRNNLEEWKLIFQKSQEQKENVSSFMNSFGRHMAVGSMELSPLQEGDLVAAALSTKPSAPLLDPWRPVEEFGAVVS